jgi:hypothetical protein
LKFLQLVWAGHLARSWAHRANAPFGRRRVHHLRILHASPPDWMASPPTPALFFNTSISKKARHPASYF